MSRFEFKLPDIGEGVTEGEIVSWLVHVGDAIAENQDMVEVMTDKATVTIGAPKAGKVVEIRGGEGDVMPVGAVLVVLEHRGRFGPWGVPPLRSQSAEPAPAKSSPSLRPAPRALSPEGRAPAEWGDRRVGCRGFDGRVAGASALASHQ